MTRVQPNAQWVYICGKGDDDGRPYVALVDVDGKIIVSGGAAAVVDAADVTYTPAVGADWTVVPAYVAPGLDELASRVNTIEGMDILNSYPVRTQWFHETSFVVTGNAILRTINTGQLYCHYAYQNLAANGDVNTNSAFLKAGDYTISILGYTAASCGRLDIDFKHSSDVGYTNIVTAQEWYTAGNVLNVIKTATFTVVTSGRQIFRFTINGKHASSTSYNMILTRISISLTAGDS